MPNCRDGPQKIVSAPEERGCMFCAAGKSGTKLTIYRVREGIIRIAVGGPCPSFVASGQKLGGVL